MRLMGLAMFILLVPAVSAVSILLPQEISEGDLKVYYNESNEVDFVIRGEQSLKNITFYVRSADPAVTMSGSQNFSTTFQLSNYQTKSVGVVFRGVAPENNVLVKYGIVVSTPQSSGIGFQDVTESNFNVDVICRTSSNCPHSLNNINVSVTTRNSSTSTTTSSSSPSSGGGGGSVASPLTSSPSNSVDGGGDSVLMKDITPNDSSLVQAIVDSSDSNSGSEPKVPSFVSTFVSGNVPSGKNVLLGVIGLLVLSLVLELSAITLVKRGVDV